MRAKSKRRGLKKRYYPAIDDGDDEKVSWSTRMADRLENHLRVELEKMNSNNFWNLVSEINPNWKYHLGQELREAGNDHTNQQEVLNNFQMTYSKTIEKTRNDINNLRVCGDLPGRHSSSCDSTLQMMHHKTQVSEQDLVMILVQTEQVWKYMLKYFRPVNPKFSPSFIGSVKLYQDVFQSAFNSFNVRGSRRKQASQENMYGAILIGKVLEIAPYCTGTQTGCQLKLTNGAVLNPNTGTLIAKYWDDESLQWIGGSTNWLSLEQLHPFPNEHTKCYYAVALANERGPGNEEHEIGASPDDDIDDDEITQLIRTANSGYHDNFETHHANAIDSDVDEYDDDDKDYDDDEDKHYCDEKIDSVANTKPRSFQTVEVLEKDDSIKLRQKPTNRSFANKSLSNQFSLAPSHETTTSHSDQELDVKDSASQDILQPAQPQLVVYDNASTATKSLDSSILQVDPNPIDRHSTVEQTLQGSSSSIMSREDCRWHSANRSDKSNSRDTPEAPITCDSDNLTLERMIPQAKFQYAEIESDENDDQDENNLELHNCCRDQKKEAEAEAGGKGCEPRDTRDSVETSTQKPCQVQICHEGQPSQSAAQCKRKHCSTTEVAKQLPVHRSTPAVSEEKDPAKSSLLVKTASSNQQNHHHYVAGPVLKKPKSKRVPSELIALGFGELGIDGPETFSIKRRKFRKC